MAESSIPMQCLYYELIKPTRKERSLVFLFVRVWCCRRCIVRMVEAIARTLRNKETFSKVSFLIFLPLHWPWKSSRKDEQVWAGRRSPGRSLVELLLSREQGSLPASKFPQSRSMPEDEQLDWESRWNWNGVSQLRVINPIDNYPVCL